MNARPIVSPDDQTVTFVELFFDLVFVFSVTQVAGLFHEHIEWSTVGSAALIFWLVWWAWTQFTWALNAANTDHYLIQLVTLLATAVAFFLAVSVPNAIGEGALWFAIPYVAVRLVGLLVYRWVSAADQMQKAAVQTFSLLSLAGLSVVLVGAVLGGTFQYWLWGFAIVLDVLAAVVGAQLEGWNLHPSHFVERHGLIVIIALGESLIAAAAGVTDAPRTAALIAAGVLTVAVSCALWWTYFPYVKPAFERAMEVREGRARSCLARDIFSIVHFPMLCGIIAFAVAIEASVARPDMPLVISFRTALAVGLALFICGTAVAIWRATGRILFVRMLSVLSTAGVVVVADVPAYVSLGIVLVMLVGIAILEHRTFGAMIIRESVVAQSSAGGI
jgi:low temperature requirement protein LtrA